MHGSMYSEESIAQFIDYCVICVQVNIDFALDPMS